MSSCPLLASSFTKHYEQPPEPNRTLVTLVVPLPSTFVMCNTRTPDPAENPKKDRTRSLKFKKLCVVSIEAWSEEISWIKREPLDPRQPITIGRHRIYIKRYHIHAACYKCRDQRQRLKRNRDPRQPRERENRPWDLPDLCLWSKRNNQFPWHTFDFDTNLIQREFSL